MSMVVMTSCEGDIDGAARAVASAAADGDLQSFGAGLSVGATAIAGSLPDIEIREVAAAASTAGHDAAAMLAAALASATFTNRIHMQPFFIRCVQSRCCTCKFCSVCTAGPDDMGRGQLAQIIHETLTVADSKNKTVGVASALGNALAAMAGTAAEAMADQTVEAIDDLGTDVSCSVATDAASCKLSAVWSNRDGNSNLAARSAFSVVCMRSKQSSSSLHTP